MLNNQSAMKVKSILLVLITILLICCEDKESSGIGSDNDTIVKELFLDQYDPIRDNGQYWHLGMDVLPENYISCAFVAYQGGNNSIGINDLNQGLQAQLLAQSAAGIINRAVQRGEIKTGVWFRDEQGFRSYKLAKQSLTDMGISELGVCVPSQLPTAYEEFRSLIRGYILTDVVSNPESAIVASVASHVYDAIIVDRRDEHFYSQY